MKFWDGVACGMAIGFAIGMLFTAVMFDELNNLKRDLNASRISDDRAGGHMAPDSSRPGTMKPE